MFVSFHSKESSKMFQRSVLFVFAVTIGSMVYCDSADAQIFRCRRAKPNCCAQQPACPQPVAAPCATSYSSTPAYPMATNHTHCGSTCTPASGATVRYGCHCHGGDCTRSNCDRGCVERNAPHCLIPCTADPSGAACLTCLGVVAATCCELNCTPVYCHCH